MSKPNLFGNRAGERLDAVRSRGPESRLAGYRLLVSSLFSSPTSILLSNVVGVGVPAFCWYVTELQVFIVLTIVAAIVVACRAFTVLRYLRRKHDTDNWLQTRRWDCEYQFGATTYALALGLNCLVALAYTDNVPAHIITIVSAIAFSSGYVARNSGRPYFVILQLLCFCIPMLIGLHKAGLPYYGLIAAFIALYVLTNIAITFSLKRNLVALAAAYEETQGYAARAKRQASALDAALNAMTHGLAMFDRDLKLEVRNARHLALYRVPSHLLEKDASLGAFLEAWELSGLSSAGTASRLLAACRSAIADGECAKLEVEVADDSTYVVEVTPTSEGGCMLLTEDATSRKRIAAQIERMARTDSLTGLSNRFAFNQGLAVSCAHSAATGDPLWLFYIDLDNFKNVNDSLGHHAGDKLLVAVANRLTAVVGTEDAVARFGGDEFLIRFEPGRDARASGPLPVATRLIEAIRAPIEVDGRLLDISASIGIATAPNHGWAAAELMCAADMALYEAKAAGRNRASLFHPRIAEAFHKRRQLEQNLSAAFEASEISLHYQPIVDIATGHVVSVEALMRWYDPERGFVAPGDFIPVAEQNGFIDTLGAWALDQACADAADWPAHVRVAVNVSAKQFKDPERLVSSVKTALEQHGVEPGRLEIEVTESVLIDDPEETLAAMQKLRGIGVHFALDDFGTGYSSLAYLARYPFSKVKIDRAFSRTVMTDRSSRYIIEAICQLARRLDLQVVVEGIESERQLTTIAELGADHAQGYHLGRPGPVGTLKLDASRAA